MCRPVPSGLMIGWNSIPKMCRMISFSRWCSKQPGRPDVCITIRTLLSWCFDSVDWLENNSPGNRAFEPSPTYINRNYTPQKKNPFKVGSRKKSLKELESMQTEQLCCRRDTVRNTCKSFKGRDFETPTRDCCKYRDNV
jgi:hypothetical protein